MVMDIFLLCMLITTFAMVAAKRMTALVNGFIGESLFLFFFTLTLGLRSAHAELLMVAALLFIIKVIFIPYSLKRISNKIKAEEDLGLFINPMVSIFISGGLVYLAYLFTRRIISMPGAIENAAFFVSLAMILIGIFIMVSRMKALAQVAGLLVIENGLFLAASAVSGGMPFFVEIAIFFDIFLCVTILGIFVYKINRLFTHIDVDKLTELKG